MPIHGVSMAYSLNDANAPTRKRTQYYELLGDRAIWHDGWKAVTHHAKGESFDADCWGLYNLDEDFSECHDLAETHPERLQQLIDLWWAEAGRYDVLPLDDRDWERLLGTIGRSSRTRFTYFQGTDRVDRLAAPNLTNRSWTLTADLEVSAPGAEGVILSAGGRFGGYALFMKGGRAVFEYNYANEVRYVIESDVAIPPGASQLRLDVHKTGEHRAVAEMFLGDRQVGAIELSKTFPSLPNTQGIHCGRDWGTPVSEAYECPFTFTGTIHRVVIDVGGTEVRDVARETREAMADQ
jgi:arylsulfatase